MGKASLTITDAPDGGVSMEVEYVGVWNPDSLAHRYVADLANAIGEPIGEPVIAAADKVEAGPKLILAAG